LLEPHHRPPVVERDDANRAIPLLLHTNPNDPLRVIRVCVEKQRNGPVSVVPLDYRRAVVRFEQGRII
jgi:replicative DNA helicase